MPHSIIAMDFTQDDFFDKCIGIGFASKGTFSYEVLREMTITDFNKLFSIVKPILEQMAKEK